MWVKCFHWASFDGDICEQNPSKCSRIAKETNEERELFRQSAVWKNKFGMLSKETVSSSLIPTVFCVAGFCVYYL